MWQYCSKEATDVYVSIISIIEVEYDSPRDNH